MAETSPEHSHRHILGFSPNVFFLGVVSFLTDVSSEMIFTLVPLFLSNVLGAATSVVGLVGGLSDATDALFRFFSGWYSDRIRRQKVFAVVGYGLATAVKPLMYVATAWGAVVAIRFTDRVGKGLRSTPRDALLASSLLPSERGKGFGFHRAMDTAGATLGLALAAVIIYSMEGTALELTRQSFQRLVLIGLIPAVLGVIVLLLFVHEKRESREQKAAGRATPAPVRSPLDARFKLYLVILGLFTLGRGASDFFVILRAQNLDVPLVQVTLMLVVMNGAYALMSLPMGVVSDKLGRRRIIATGWFIYALVYLGFALATHLWQAWLLFAGFGIYQGVVEGVGRAFVADLVPEGRRGTGYGLQQGVTGLLVLPAGVIAGFLWDRIAPAAPFYLGAGLAFVAMVGILTLIREPKGIAAK
jgi:MFS family permease